MRNEPVAYTLRNATSGTEWTLGVYVYDDRKKVHHRSLYLSRGDAEAVKEVLERAYGEEWTVEEVTPDG